MSTMVHIHARWGSPGSDREIYNTHPASEASAYIEPMSQQTITNQHDRPNQSGVTRESQSKESVGYCIYRKGRIRVGETKDEIGTGAQEDYRLYRKAGAGHHDVQPTRP